MKTGNALVSLMGATTHKRPDLLRVTTNHAARVPVPQGRLENGGSKWESVDQDDRGHHDEKDPEEDRKDHDDAIGSDQIAQLGDALTLFGR